MNYISLNDGIKIPQIGFGVFMIPADGSTYKAVREALAAGYRHIDTAAAYFNEEEVGQAIKDSGIVREDIFLTSKLWLQDHGYEAAEKGIRRSLNHLGTYIDLYLIHQPYGDVPGAWEAMEEAKQQGDILSIGVSNMTPAIYKKFVTSFDTKPSVNQVEYNPLFQQKPLREVLAADKVTLEAWYPLGHGNEGLMNHPAVTALAKRYGKSAAQIILRFEIQEGIIVLPKLLNPDHMKANLDVFDFSLTSDDMQSLYALDTGKGNHNPDAPGVEEVLRKAFVIKD